ncbi:hypothetical protein L0V05_05370 [Tabrizicola sp. J26]|uniref:hypothetical protein n=1 Tax=Alitabrizicola rongguiensis TaxID=2909234 RepID=UPI001F2F4FA1|nr:hypothetical protein [Tabrizicola rongguiensis]MCF1708248.1 hypothetical protein [Tabrizicola rongguiensis]
MAKQDTQAEEPAEAEIVEETAAPRIELPSEAPRRRSSAGAFIGLLLGGVAAAAIGFGLARYLPNGWPMPDIAALQAEIAAQKSTIAELQQELANLPAPATSDISADLDALRTEFAAKLAALPPPAQDESADVSALQSSLAALNDRLATLEKQPAGEAGAASSTAVAAFERELQTLRQQIEAQGSVGSAMTADLQTAMTDAKAQLASAAEEAKKVAADAEALAQAARNDLAIGRVSSALEAGGSFSGALDDLRTAGVTIPDALSADAAGGVPTLVDLQRSFPDAAREALAAALRADAGSTWSERVGAFLRTQAGIRSLTPREGDDPDAVLSRAEASLADGDLAAVLAGIASLPEAAQAAMSGWVAEATKRQAAVDALAALSASLATK